LDGSLEDYRWLVSEAARPWLERTRDELTAARGASATLLNRLRKDLSAAQAHLLVEQVELRQRAREKFSRAEQMFFTRKCLEQATDERIAAYKASRFIPPGAVADLCCGIGGDALALARRGCVIAVDEDPIACLLVQANSVACGLDAANLRTSTGDAAAFSVERVAAWHMDPDRRVHGKRTTRVDLFQPPLATIESLVKRNRNASIKLAPAAEAPEEWSQEAELEWLGSRGECRQQVAWFGLLARHPGRRSATIVDAAGGPRTIVGTGDERIPVSAELGRYLYEPHAAILAAKLTSALCHEYALAAISAGIAYLTNDIVIRDPALAAFEVREILPLDQKQLKAWCRKHRVGRLEVKKRGVELDPEKLRRAIVADGEQSATLVVTAVGGKARAIVTGRLSEASDRILHAEC
jgi:hypothetical protein